MNAGENNLSLAEERIEIHELRLLFGNMLIFGIVMLLGSWSWFVGAHHQQPRTLLPNLIENSGIIVLPILAGGMCIVSICSMRLMPILFSLMNTALALLLSLFTFVFTSWRDFAPNGYN